MRNKKKKSLVFIMTPKKLHENGHLFSVLGNSKLRPGKAILKQGIENEFINLLSELSLNLTEGNVQLHAKQHCSLVRSLP